MEYWLTGSPLPGVILWIILYVSDYYLTILTSKGYKGTGHFQYEGSFELTPQFQKDIDALRPISRLHLTLLAVYSLIIIILWWMCVTVLGLPSIYLLYLGIFLLSEVAVHMRHFRNIFIIREINAHGGVDGQVTYHRFFSYRASAIDLFISSGLFLVVSILTFSPFFLGGSLICFGLGIRHRLTAKKFARPVGLGTPG